MRKPGYVTHHTTIRRLAFVGGFKRANVYSQEKRRKKADIKAKVKRDGSSRDAL